MGKLKSPSCLLAGTPLSADEMKQITGGMEFSRTCVCEFYSQGQMLLSTHPKSIRKVNVKQLVPINTMQILPSTTRIVMYTPL